MKYQSTPFSVRVRTKWQKHVDAQQASGLSQAAYCRTDGINSAYFNSWKRKLLQIQADTALSSTATATSPHQKSSGMIPVIVKKSRCLRFQVQSPLTLLPLR